MLQDGFKPSSVDLLFEKTPVTGPPWNLLFGELAGPAPSRTLTLAREWHAVGLPSGKTLDAAEALCAESGSPKCAAP